MVMHRSRRARPRPEVPEATGEHTALKEGRCWSCGSIREHPGAYGSIPQMLLPTLLEGYREALPLPPDRERRISLVSVLIGVRALARNLRRQPPDAYQRHLASAIQRSIALLNS